MTAKPAPNSVFYAVLATAGLTALAVLVLAANAAGRRRERRRAWLRGPA